MNLRIALILTTLWCTAALRPLSAADTWWNPAWNFRKQIQVRGAAREAGSDTAVVQFSTAGNTLADGADIRIVDSAGKEAATRVVNVGPGDRVLVAFQMAPSVSDYFAYFGHPSPPARAGKPYEFQAGLLEEVRELGKGSVNSWKEVQQLLQNSPTVMGRRFVGQISQGFNPFGRGWDYISLFTGWFRAPKDGEYLFATESWDASFVLVDGELVVSWPGWHNPLGGAHGEHNGRIRLTAGVHRIEYVNVTGQRGQGCTAGWKPPGASEFEVIPAGAFVGLSRAWAGGLEKRGKEFVGDFDWKIMSDLGLEDRSISSLSFTDTSTGTAAGKKSATQSWDFGDGTSSTDLNPTHVYLESGVFTVTLELDDRHGGKERVSQKVAARPFWADAGAGLDARLREYWSSVSRYPVDRLSPRANLNLAWIADQLGYERKVLEALAACFAGKPNLEPQELYDNRLRLGDLYRNTADDYPHAIECFQAIASQVKNAEWVSMAKSKMGHIYLDDLVDLDKAEAQFRDLTEKQAGVPGIYLRYAKISLGVIDLLRGDAKKAQAAFEKVQATPGPRGMFGDVELTAGNHVLSFGQYLARMEYESAEQELFMWEYETPTVLLKGESNLLRGQLYVAQKRYAAAARQYRRLIQVNPTSNDVPKALLVLGDCLKALGKNDEAAAAWQDLVSNHAESPLSRDAAERLKGGGKPGTGK